MNRYLLAIPIWNKQDMISAILTGFRACIEPPVVDLLFMFDGCTDDSYSIYQNIVNDILPDYKKYSVVHAVAQFEFKCHNIAIDLMMECDYQATIVFQDDTILVQPTFITYVDSILGYENIGVIGCRDGFITMDGKAIGSSWSEPKSNRVQDLVIGQASRVVFVNNGPMIYPRSTIEKMGKLDTESFIYHYADIDYSGRCNGNGLFNYVLGTDILHFKFGKITPNKVYDSNIFTQDTSNFTLRRDNGLYE